MGSIRRVMFRADSPLIIFRSFGARACSFSRFEFARSNKHKLVSKPPSSWSHSIRNFYTLKHLKNMEVVQEKLKVLRTKLDSIPILQKAEVSKNENPFCTKTRRILRDSASSTNVSSLLNSLWWLYHV